MEDIRALGSRWGCVRAATASAFAVAMAVVGAVPASASVASEEAHWAGPVHLGPDRPGIPTSLSCATPTRCRVVDSLGNAATYDGNAWTPVHCVGVDGRHPAALHRYDDGWGGARRFVPRGYTSEVTGLSCPTVERCVVVDDNGNAFVRS